MTNVGTGRAPTQITASNFLCWMSLWILGLPTGPRCVCSTVSRFGSGAVAKILMSLTYEPVTPGQRDNNKAAHQCTTQKLFGFDSFSGFQEKYLSPSGSCGAFVMSLLYCLILNQQHNLFLIFSKHNQNIRICFVMILLSVYANLKCFKRIGK